MLIVANEEEVFDYEEIMSSLNDEEALLWGYHRLMRLYITGRFTDGAKLSEIRVMFLAAKPFTNNDFKRVVEGGLASGLFKLIVSDTVQPGPKPKYFYGGQSLKNFRAHEQQMKEKVMRAALSSEEDWSRRLLSTGSSKRRSKI